MDLLDSEGLDRVFRENPDITSVIHFAGLMFLMALMLVVMYHDITKIL